MMMMTLGKPQVQPSTEFLTVGFTSVTTKFRVYYK